MLGRLLGVGTFWKILLANALVVACALALAPDALHVLRPDLSSFTVLAVVTVATLLANAVVLRLALAPLTELERAAERVANGDLAARARLSPLADRPLAGLTQTFNNMVQSVEAQRELARDVASRALTDAEEANRRLSRDLRDETAQVLASAMLRLRGVKAIEDPAAREAALDEVRAAVSEAIDQIRSLAGQLRPSGLDLLGVDKVIEAYATNAVRGTGIRLTVTRKSLRDALAPEAEVELLRLAQELIGRALARADSRVWIDISRTDCFAGVRIAGDGGEPLFACSEDRALFALRERASYFGGTIEVTNAIGEAAVQVRFPLNPAG